eukprot:scaffold2.g6902.t1
MTRARCAALTVRQLVCSSQLWTEVASSQAASSQQLVQQTCSGALARAAAWRPWQLRTAFAARPLSAAAGGEQAASGGGGSGARQGARGQQAVSAAQQQQQGLVEAEEEFSAITDKIPQRPVTVAEGTSYTLLIVGALGFAGAVLYAAVNELFLSPKEYVCYNQTVEKLKEDPRVTVRLGSTVTAYGTESRNRASRQRIPHRRARRLQFHLRGPSGRATVNADMYKEGSAWRYHFLYMDVEAPVPQQVVFVRPGQSNDS